MPLLAGYEHSLWETLLELSDLRQREWTLIGGQMVLMHATEHGVVPPRVSTDLDVLVNARVVSGAVRLFVRAIEERGFSLDGASPQGVAHRYRRGSVSLDVLAPEGLGDRADLTTTPPGRTVQVPGGTQALNRTELVPVVAGLSKGHVPRPSLVGAVIIKAVAVGVDDLPEAQRADLALLLSLIREPIAMRRRLTPKDRKRLQARHELRDSLTCGLVGSASGCSRPGPSCPATLGRLSAASTNSCRVMSICAELISVSFSCRLSGRRGCGWRSWGPTA